MAAKVCICDYIANVTISGSDYKRKVLYIQLKKYQHLNFAFEIFLVYMYLYAIWFKYNLFTFCNFCTRNKQPDFPPLFHTNFDKTLR